MIRAVLILLLVAGGCASPSKRPDPGDGTSTSSRKGKYPIGFTQKGKASWYGKRFHGRKTASGQRYNMNDLTGAHRSLPFGTLVKVKNLASGKSVTVKVNDRGPFVKGRIIDVSKAAAEILGLVKAGVASVEIRVVGP